MKAVRPKGALIRFPCGRSRSLPRPAGWPREDDASIAGIPAGSGAAQAAGSTGVGRGRQGSRDRRAPARADCAAAPGEAASLPACRPGILAAASRRLAGTRWTHFMVTPKTLLRWHRELVRLKWARYRKHLVGRPPLQAQGES
jgi:hypothetical protein